MDQRRNAKTSVNGRCVFLSLPIGSVKLLSFKCQLKLSEGHWGCQRFQALWIFVSWRLEAWRKIIPACNELSLYSFIILSSFAWCHIIYQFLNHKKQIWNRPLTRLFFPSVCRKTLWERDYHSKGAEANLFITAMLEASAVSGCLSLIQIHSFIVLLGFSSLTPRKLI